MASALCAQGLNYRPRSVRRLHDFQPMSSLDASKKVAIVSRSTSTPQLGPSFRSPRNGPELRLIETFLSAQPFTVRAGHRATIFREPQIDSGSPDIVVVIWQPRLTAHWPQARLTLIKQDFKTIHYLFQNGPRSQEEIKRIFGRRTEESLSRLRESKIIDYEKSQWKARSLSSIFCIRHLIAVEAKLGKTLDAIAQALLNTRFAADSYVLLPRLPKSHHVPYEASRFGIGLLNPPMSLRNLTPTGPLSYISWMFNDWAWRFDRLPGTETL
jgi:hypothetical protein